MLKYFLAFAMTILPKHAIAILNTRFREKREVLRARGYCFFMLSLGFHLSIIS